MHDLGQIVFRLSCLCWKTWRTASLWSSSCRLQILKSSEKAIGLWHRMCCKHVPAELILATSKAPFLLFLPLFFCRPVSRTDPKSGCFSVRLVVLLRCLSKSKLAMCLKACRREFRQQLKAFQCLLIVLLGFSGKCAPAVLRTQGSCCMC